MRRFCSWLIYLASIRACLRGSRFGPLCHPFVRGDIAGYGIKTMLLSVFAQLFDLRFQRFDAFIALGQRGRDIGCFKALRNML